MVQIAVDRSFNQITVCVHLALRLQYTWKIVTTLCAPYLCGGWVHVYAFYPYLCKWLFPRIIFVTNICKEADFMDQTHD